MNQDKDSNNVVYWCSVVVMTTYYFFGITKQKSNSKKHAFIFYISKTIIIQKNYIKVLSCSKSHRNFCTDLSILFIRVLNSK